MNLIYGEIAEVFVEDGMRMRRVRVSGAIKQVPLDLLTDAKCGDTVLECDGVAISRMSAGDSTEENDVSSNSR